MMMMMTMMMDDIIGSKYEKQYDDCDHLKMNENPTQLGNGNLIYPNEG